jgi:Ca2+:H+ antiporter
VARRLLFGSLALAPIALLVHFLAHPGGTIDFALSAIALVPLAWLIGDATEQAAEHTGPGIGGFLNATFGNAPELIIALFAVADRLFEVVRGSLTGSVVSNLLLVLGLSLVFGGRATIDRRSAFSSVSLVALAVLLFLIPAIPASHGDPNRHEIAVLSIGPAVVLLVVYVVVTYRALQRHHALHGASAVAPRPGWSLRTSLLVLAAATGVTAIVAEILVGSLEHFADAAGLTDFFVAAVIVAIVGNAAEHGGAIVVAARGRVGLAVEIALASSAQVAVFLVPAVAIVAWAIHPLALSFRWIELAALGIAVAVTAVVLSRGRSSRWRGVVLVAAYVGIAGWFFAAGDRS